MGYSSMEDSIVKLLIKLKREKERAAIFKAKLKISKTIKKHEHKIFIKNRKLLKQSKDNYDTVFPNINFIKNQVFKQYIINKYFTEN